MRGSPLLRFFLLALALVATGAGLARITGAKESPATGPSRPARAETVAASNAVPFRLLLSAPAKKVEIDTGTITRPETSDPSIAGLLPLDLKNPTLALRVEWQSPASPGEHRFAKLTLEIPGQPTFTHVFDSSGGIDDFIELPLPAAP